MTEMTTVWVVIPAAGVGARMLTDRPKQYLQLAGRTVLEHSVSCFAHHPRVRGIVLAVSMDDTYWPELELPSSVPLHCVPGGETRAESVLSALNFLVALTQNEANDSWVLVHDAARPCVRREDIDLLLASLHDDPVGGLLAVPVRDTMKRAGDDGLVVHTEPRMGLWHALTPQMFRLSLLHASLQRALEQGMSVTDESSAIELAGYCPRLIEGHADNIKITRPEDLALAEFYLQQREAAL